MMSSSNNLKERYRILFALYDITKGYCIQHAWPAQISNYLKYDETKQDELLNTCVYLKKEGLLEFKYLGPGIVITNYGIKEIEESVVNPSNSTINFPPHIVKSVEVTEQLLKLVHTIRKARREFLQELYHVTNGNELAMVNSFE
jgi:hypothetical protein